MVPVSGGLIDPTDAARLDAQASKYRAASRATGTRRAYLSDLRDFAAWCNDYELSPLPAEASTVARYLADLAARGRSVSTVNRRKAAIAAAHRAAGLDSPTDAEDARNVLAGIRNTHGKRPAKKQALTADLVARVVRKIPAKGLRNLRDRALILLCFGAALRRSELVALDVADLEWHRRGLLVRLQRSKTDQAGEGQSVAVLGGRLKIPDAVRAWLDAAEIVDGPVFRGFDRAGDLMPAHLSDGQFARTLKKWCAAAGLDPDLFSGHSPRRGFATSADDAGADLRDVAGQLRHARLDTTAGYMEAGDKFRRNAGKGFV